MQGISAQRRREFERLAAARAGDPSALAELYEDHVDGLWAFVFYRVSRDATACEDVVAETFLLAIEHSDRFDPARGSLSAWLIQLSRNQIRKHLRERGRSQALPQTWSASLDAAPLGEELLVREETRALVHVTIANLPGDYRDALERKYLRGQSMRELAAAFELSEVAAKSLLARARRAFRDAFEALTETSSEAPSAAAAAATTTEEQDHVRA
ncbi:sigma-70 family RNA polymerase sigma factor [Pseudenhygromyxa sp. WMMC2535]|uniref:RNA polymerase sigma factor n=1 Tax=Pseudenhygromyxa sp. WMMC2535 TaxID=2712867 RepID=UPI001553CA31|nr:sigma-70 family RNA polymerase sigma factor [Pseudenhygromyxa sp. WMMC2535]NVB41202.1 sigma-70 family RNA polymerase sigma factor [Pseudenhygromyxa sp. WMMC2535]